MPAQPMARPNRTVAPPSVMTSLVRLVRNAWSRYSPRVGVSPRRLGAVPASTGSHEVIHLGNPWYAVAIKAGRRSCQTCVQLGERRFLSKEAPRLPLEGCTQPGGCECVYVHFSDRRVGARRTVEAGDGGFAATARQWAAEPPGERRRSPGRRASDHHWHWTTGR